MSATSRPEAVPTSGLLGDALLAILVGILFALSPLSSGSRPLVSAAGGVLAAPAFFALRRAIRRPPDVRPEARAAGSVSRWLPLAAAAAFAFAPALVQLYPWHTESVWRSGHGLFLPLLCFGLVRAAFAEHPDEPAEGTAWGFAALVPGLALIVVDASARTMHLSVVGLALATAGASLLLLGARWTRRLAVPIALLLFLLPLPESLARSARIDVASAAGTAWVLQQLGFSVALVGRGLALPAELYVFSYRCSGFGALYGGLAAALALGSLGGSVLRGAVLLLAVWPLTVAANVARAAGLVAFCEWQGSTASATPVHGLSGILAFFAVIGGLVLLSVLLSGWRPLRRLLA